MHTIFLKGDAVVMIDQTRLPGSLTLHTCETVECLIEAIQSLRVRGAPALGAAGAYGVFLSAIAHRHRTHEDFVRAVSADADAIASARPTAVNLSWGVDRQRNVFLAAATPPEAVTALRQEAERIAEEDVRTNRRLGKAGAALIESGDGILTHCNAGALACVGYGTALGVVRAAVEEGKRIHVYVDETRPLCQGSRLTAWELQEEGIPATLITDSMAGYLMSTGRIHKVVVGADRIAANGDVANKIGTYGVAVLARHHGIPFYVAAPVSTIDYALPDGSGIPIEERDPDEVRRWQGVLNAPPGIDVLNPAFDVTPAYLVSGIITEEGVATPPFEASLRRFKP